MKDVYIRMLNSVCKKYHKDRIGALEMLITLEDEQRTKAILSGQNTNFMSSYFLGSLGRLSAYYKKYNENKNRGW